MSSPRCHGHRRSFRGGNVFWEEWVPHVAHDPHHPHHSSPQGSQTGEMRRPAVLVHGLADTCRTWNRIAPALARDRRLYALDLPGHGRSSRYDGPYHVAWYASLVAEWIRSL